MLSVLQEFQFLRPKNLSSGSSSDRQSEDGNFFLDYRAQGTPFDDLLNSEEHSEDVLIERDVH